MDNNNKKLNVLALIALIIAGVSAIMAILGTAFTCACSASKTWNKNNKTIFSAVVDHKMSLVWILSLVAAVIAVVAVVLAIVALAKARTCKMAIIALAIGLFATVYAVVPMLTICSYNCAIESASKKLVEKNKQEEEEEEDDDDYDDDFDIDFDF